MCLVLLMLSLLLKLAITRKSLPISMDQRERRKQSKSEGKLHWTTNLRAKALFLFLANFTIKCERSDKKARKINLGQIDEGNWKKLLMRRVQVRCHMKDASFWLGTQCKQLGSTHGCDITSKDRQQSHFPIFSEFNFRCFLAFMKIFQFMILFLEWINLFFFYVFVLVYLITNCLELMLDGIQFLCCCYIYRSQST